MVHKKRFPQHHWPKLSFWFGPFKVLKVHFNSLQVLASPSLGGLIDVAMHMCKKWTVDLMEESVIDDGDVVDDMENPLVTPTNESEKDEVMTPAEQEALGFYNVSRIIRHKYQQGWKFLVVWEGFPVSAATWEPISAFFHPNGRVNSVFKEFCEERGLTEILNKAISRV